MPRRNLNKWKKKGLTLNTKISQFYISNGLCWLLLRTTLIQRNMSTDRILVFFFLPFVFDYHLQSQLSNAQCTAAYDLFLAAHALWTFFFHITKLQFYSHIFKFNVLFVFFFQTSKYYTSLVPYAPPRSTPTPNLRLQKSLLSALKVTFTGGGGGDW